MNVHHKIPADGALAYAKGYCLMQNPFRAGTVAHDRWSRDWRWQAEIHSADRKAS